jgi:RES domain-containing protein
MDDSKLPVGLSLIRIEYPETLACEDIQETELPAGWPSLTEFTRNAGDQWLENCKTALLSIPSAAAPYTRNFLGNPEHPDWRFVAVQEHLRFELDPRLKQLGDYALSYRNEIRYVLCDE